MHCQLNNPATLVWLCYKGTPTFTTQMLLHFHGFGNMLLNSYINDPKWAKPNPMYTFQLCSLKPQTSSADNSLAVYFSANPWLFSVSQVNLYLGQWLYNYFIKSKMVFHKSSIALNGCHRDRTGSIDLSLLCPQKLLWRW